MAPGSASRSVSPLGMPRIPLPRPRAVQPLHHSHQDWARPRLQRREALGSLLVLAGIGLGWKAWRLARDGTDAHPVHRTATGETRRVLLPDGTRVTLGTATALAQAFDDDRRALRLRSGEIFVDSLAGDATRPLVIESPAGRVLARAGRFTVRCFDGTGGPRTRIDVETGQVHAEPRHQAAFPIDAGEQILFDASGIVSRGPSSAGHSACQG